MMKVLLIVPAYNEEQNIERVVEQILSYRKNCPYFLDYILINDGSTDQTELICRKNGIHHITLLQNLGIGGAVQTGYMYAEMNGYDIAVQFDGDGQHDIRCLMDLVQPIITDQCDFCIGSRFVDNTSSFRSTKLRRIGINYLSGLIQLFAKCKVTDPTSGFRAANKRVIRELADYYPLDYPEPESIVQISKRGYRIQEVQVNMFERVGGVSSIHSWKSIYYMIKESVAIICASMQKGQKR
jgi:glycosyltransferase involved in cell wall biosynthesis